MKQETSVVARNYRLQQWAAMVQECKQRPENMSVRKWCRDYGISESLYYYRLKEVRKSFLSEFKPTESNQIVPVPDQVIHEPQSMNSTHTAGLDLCINDISVHVDNNTDLSLLKEVVQVIRYVK